MSALLATFGGTPAFGWNPVADLGEMWSYGFFQHAAEAGTVVAVVAGVVGYFVVVRRSAFAAHALSHIGFAGAAGAVALSVAPVWGLLVFCLGAGGLMGSMGQRVRSRDTVVGTVLAFALGLGALFLSLYHGAGADEAMSLLFGDVLGVTTGDVLRTVVVGGVAIGLVAVMYRPLLFASVDEDVAEARRVPVRALSVVFMLVLALAVAVAVQVVGVLLVFALLVTPAAIAERVTRSPAASLAVSVVAALVCTWAGLVISWYSSYPVSFFITAIAFAGYVLARSSAWASSRWRSRRPVRPGPEPVPHRA